MWYGLHLGLTYEETMDLPIGDVLELIAIDQIRSGQAKEKKQEDFWDLLKRK